MNALFGRRPSACAHASEAATNAPNFVRTGIVTNDIGGSSTVTFGPFTLTFTGTDGGGEPGLA
jgi:hypothetical protein